MAYRLACELSHQIAAVAVNAASMDLKTCRPGRPVPVLQFHGTADTFAPYNGGRNIIGREGIGAPQTIKRWLDLNGCVGQPEVTYAKGNATCVTHSSCNQDADVVLCTIQGMGHQWPGFTVQVTAEQAKSRGLPPWYARLGPGTDDLDATDMLLQFFQGHPMPGP
jgi:polyhydroxybutyrate depolymerase